MNYELFLKLKLITDPFYRSDTINTQLLADLADMHINSTVANDHIIAPHLVQDFISEENTAGLLGE